MVEVTMAVLGGWGARNNEASRVSALLGFERRRPRPQTGD